MERRLTAIVAADVTHCTRLLSEDAAAMLSALSKIRNGVFEPAVAEYDGSVIKRTGDE